jgi:GxxExxY protein
MDENEIAKIVVDAAYKIHSTVGPGLLESAYEAMMAYELRKRNLVAICQQSIPIYYDGVRLEIGFRADMIVEDKVIVEFKSIEELAPIHFKQLLTYLRLTDKRLGLLINFGEEYFKNGVKRVANGMPEEDRPRRHEGAMKNSF